MQTKLPILIRKSGAGKEPTVQSTQSTQISQSSQNTQNTQNTSASTVTSTLIRPKLKVPLIVPKNRTPVLLPQQNPQLQINPQIPVSNTNTNNNGNNSNTSNSNNKIITVNHNDTNTQDIPFLHPEAAAAIATTMRDHAPISLLKSKTFDITNENSLLIDQFKLLVTQIEHQIRSSSSADERKKHGFRLTSIKKAIDIFEDYPGKITSGYQAKQVNGIGKGIGDRIDEILRTGSLAELTLKKFATDYTEKVRQLCGVTGIGDVRARELINKYNLEGVEDLIKRWKAGEIKVGKNELTHHMEVGLRWYYDIKQKIPRDEMDQYSLIFQEKAKLLDKRLKIQVCGSYRRGKAFSGDIDVLMTHPDLVTAADVEACPIKYLLMLVDGLLHAGILVDSLTDKGETKYMGVGKLPNLGSSISCSSSSSNVQTSVGRRIDIRFVAYESWAPAVLYFTGSGHFNKIFRGIALQRGYTVNEYGIYRLNQEGKKGEVVPTFSEQQIFAIVGVDYLTPQEREMS